MLSVKNADKYIKALVYSNVIRKDLSSIPSFKDINIHNYFHFFSIKQLPQLAEEHLRNHPNRNAIQSLERVLAVHGKYWSSLKRTQNQVEYSILEAKIREKEEAETVSALTSLSLQVGDGSVK